MKLWSIRAGASAVALAGAIAVAAGAHAQSTPQNDDRGIQEIIVRAQRVEQSLQKVPVAVTPVSARELENKRLHDLPQLTLAVPSLGVTTDNAFTLRGVGSQIFSANVDSSVGVMVDDVSLGVPV
ncbi:MAG TPA: TonB-dependent receptor, partial [Novosphingobium sp.]|nr:TonB-dependent receptor [Novosphingobium sp.]